MFDQSALSLVCVALGVLIIATRTPLVLAPEATLRVYGRLFASNARVRGLGVVGAGLAFALLAQLGGGDEHPILTIFGVVMAVASAFLLLAPGPYRTFTDFFIETMSSDRSLARALGTLGVLFGLAFVWVGLTQV